MGYLLQGAMLVLVTVIFPTVIGVLITRKRVKESLVFAFGVAVAYLFLWAYVQWDFSAGFYAPLPYFLSAFMGFIISAAACFNKQEGFNKAMLPGAIGAMIVFLAMSWAVFISSSDAWGNAKPKSKLIGEVKVVTDLNQSLTSADTSHICIVDEEMAKVGAQNALSKFKVKDGAIPGSRYEIGEPTKQYIDGQLWWIYPIEFQSWLKWRTDPQVPGYLRVSAEDPFQEGEAVQTNKQGKEISVKYLNSACWEYLAERHLRYNGYMHKILLDWTFEPDDNWDPYYTVTVAERTFGYEGLKVIGLVTLNLQTGESKFWPYGEIPDWVDRVVPLDIVDYNVKKWGEYSVEGWWYNALHNDKAQKPTKGWYLTYDEKLGAQWFSGFTSMSDKDQAMTGFTLVDARTGEMRFFRANGVTEEKAYEAARSLWSNYEGYEPSELVPYNLSGVLTYVIPMKFKGQYAGISLVSLSNVNVKGMGRTLDEAMVSFKSAYAKTAGGRMAPEGADAVLLKVSGIVERVGAPMTKGQETIFSFMLEGTNKRFQVSDSFENPEAVFLAPRQEVTCEYVSAGGPIIVCDKFDIASIVLTDENPAQARLAKNQKTAKDEAERVQKEAELGRLLESDQLKNVDPKKLQEFLKEQKK